MASRHAVHPGTDVVSTGQQAGPRRGANRTDEEPVEPRPLRRDPVVHRRVDQCIAVRPHVAKPLIVSQNKHDVGTTINSQERVVNRRQQEQYKWDKSEQVHEERKLPKIRWPSNRKSCDRLA